MSVIVELTAPAESMAMRESLSAAPELVVEIERVVGHPKETLTPYFWTHGGDRERFAATLPDDPTIEKHTQLDAFAEETLYRAEWAGDLETITYAALDSEAIILEAAGQDAEWGIRLRFKDDGDVSEFSDYCNRLGIEYDVDRIYHPRDPKSGGHFGVTTKQFEALQAALDAGYYEIPPEATMSEIATDLDISQQSLSRRLRRAHGNLVSDAVTIPKPTPDP